MTTIPTAPVHPGWSGSPTTRAPAPVDPTSFGALLGTILVDAGRSQAWLSGQVDVDHRYINRIVRGRQPIGLGLLARIVRVFPADRERLIAAALADADRRRAG